MSYDINGFLCVQISVLIPYKSIKLDKLDDFGKGSMSEFLEMKVSGIGPDHLSMSMPVKAKHLQPLGLLHGGAVAALAENVGSLAGNLVVPDDKACVGLSLNCNHLKAVKEGVVTATARFIHLGARTQVWEIETLNDQDELINVCRLTLAVVDKKR